MIYITLGIFLGCIMGIYGNIFPFFFTLFFMFLIYRLQTKEKSKIQYFIYLYLPSINFKDILIFAISFVCFLPLIRLKNTKINQVEKLEDAVKRKVCFLVLEKNKEEYKSSYVVKIVGIENNVLDYNLNSKANSNSNLNFNHDLNFNYDLNFNSNIYIKEDLIPGCFYISKLKFTNHEKPFNKGDFNIRTYNYSKNILSNLKKDKGDSIDKVNDKYVLKHIRSISVLNNIKIKWIKYISIFKENIKQYFNNNIENPLALGIILGDTKNVNNDVKNMFRVTNIYHMMSVSGTHISIVSLTIIKLLSLFKIRSTFKNFFIVFLLIIFSFLTNFTPSVVRAVISIIFTILYNKKDTYRFIDVFCFSFSINLILNPYNIFSMGLYLSYMGVLGININLRLLNKLKEYFSLDFNYGNFENISKNKMYKSYMYKVREKETKDKKLLEIKKDIYKKYEINNMSNIKQCRYYNKKAESEFKKILFYINNKRIKYFLKQKLFKSLSSVLKIIYITISIQFFILPILIYVFSSFSINIILGSILTMFMFSIIIIFGVLIIFLIPIYNFFNNINFTCLKKLINFSSYIIFKIMQYLSFMINKILDILMKVLNFILGKQDSLIYINKPNILFLFIYYLILYLIYKSLYIYFQEYAYIKEKTYTYGNFNKKDLQRYLRSLYEKQKRLEKEKFK